MKWPGIVAGFSMLAALAPSAEASDLACTSAGMIVLDASGSMSMGTLQGRPKIDVARSALTKALPHIDPNRRLGLMVFGPGAGADQCSNITLRVEPRAHTSTKIAQEIANVTTDGGTPLAAAVEAAAAAGGTRDEPLTIVVVSDGDDTCSRDPCETGQELKTASPDTVVHILSVGASAAPSLTCLAEQTGGKVIRSENETTLERAFDAVLNCPELAHGPGETRIASVATTQCMPEMER